MDARYVCPEGPHRDPQGPDEDLDVCLVCWTTTWTPRNPGPRGYERHTRDDEVIDARVITPDVDTLLRERADALGGGFGPTHERADALGEPFTPPDAHA